MNRQKSKDYDIDFVYNNLMGPNCIRIAEELTSKIQISSNMRILDLGCGTGLTSIFLAKEFGAQVFAADLWEEPKNNYDRFKLFGLEDKIIPLHVDAKDLPFSHKYFDIVFSIGAYSFFGTSATYLDTSLVPFVKSGGLIAVEIPGLKVDFNSEVPDELKPFWHDDMNLHSAKWWKDLWLHSSHIEIEQSFSFACYKEAWSDWLQCDNPYAKHDIEMIAAENGKYFDSVGMIATVK